MGIEFNHELYKSGKANRTSAGISQELIYMFDEPNIDLVLTDPTLPVDGSAHPILPGLFLNDLRVERFTNLTTKATFLYGPSTNIDLNENGEHWRWSFLSQTAHISSVKVSEDIVRFSFDNPSGDTPETTDIGKNGDKVEGADVFRKAASLTVRKEYETVLVGEAFRDNIDELSVSTNAGEWFGRKTGEVLFMGATIETSSSETSIVEYTFNFGRTLLKSAGETTIEMLTGQDVLATQLVDVDDISPFRHVVANQSKVLQRSDIVSTKGKQVNGIKSLDSIKVYPAKDLDLLGLVGP